MCLEIPVEDGAGAKTIWKRAGRRSRGGRREQRTANCSKRRDGETNHAKKTLGEKAKKSDKTKNKKKKAMSGKECGPTPTT